MIIPLVSGKNRKKYFVLERCEEDGRKKERKKERTYRSNTGLSNGEETRVKPVVGLGLAGLGCGGGHDAVVVGVEPELENVADVGLDVRRLKGQARFANLDGNGLGRAGGGESQGGGKEDVAERRHFVCVDFWFCDWLIDLSVGWYGLGY